MPARILIIEDNPTNMELMVYLLGAFGYSILTADNGRDGLDKAAAEAPDLILCDLEMPGLDGYEVARQLRNDPRSGQIPLIALTAYAMVGDREKALASGFSGYITKPISPETLVQELEFHLPQEIRAAAAPTLSDAAGTQKPASPIAEATILVVDDSPVNLDLIRSTLEPSGYSVLVAKSVEEGIAMARAKRPDLILSDLHMPIETGYRFLEHILAEPELRAIPFVLFTASTLDRVDTERQHALKLGAKRFMTRPIEPQVLLALLESVLNGD